MQILRAVKTFDTGFKGQIQLTLDTQTIDGKSWYIMTFIDNGIGRPVDELPMRNWVRLQETKKDVLSLGGTFEYNPKGMNGSTTIIKIPTSVTTPEQIKYMFDNTVKWLQHRMQYENLDI